MKVETTIDSVIPGHMVLGSIRNQAVQAVVVHAFNPSSWEAEAGRYLLVQGQHGLQSKFQDRLQSYREILSQKTQKKKIYLFPLCACVCMCSHIHACLPSFISPSLPSSLSLFPSLHLFFPPSFLFLDLSLM